MDYPEAGSIRKRKDSYIISPYTGSVCKVLKVRRRTYVVQYSNGVETIFRRIECSPSTEEAWILESVTAKLEQ